MLQETLVLNIEPRERRPLLKFVVVLSPLLYFSVRVASFPELFNLLQLSAFEKACS
jgi:hypothetical protein